MTLTAVGLNIKCIILSSQSYLYSVFDKTALIMA